VRAVLPCEMQRMSPPAVSGQGNSFRACRSAVDARPGKCCDPQRQRRRWLRCQQAGRPASPSAWCAASAARPAGTAAPAVGHGQPGLARLAAFPHPALGRRWPRAVPATASRALGHVLRSQSRPGVSWQRPAFAHPRAACPQGGGTAAGYGAAWPAARPGRAGLPGNCRDTPGIFVRERSLPACRHTSALRAYPGARRAGCCSPAAAPAQARRVPLSAGCGRCLPALAGGGRKPGCPPGRCRPAVPLTRDPRQPRGERPVGGRVQSP
jgi:hypothetical protein